MKLKEQSLYARYLCSRDALGLMLQAKAGRPNAARDDRVSCIHEQSMNFSSNDIGKTSKSRLKMSMYQLNYLVAKQNLYYMKK